MAKKWSEVAASPTFQQLAPEAQEAARMQYFDQVVAPQVDPADIDSVRSQFDADTGPAGGVPKGQGSPAAQTAAPQAPAVSAPTPEPKSGNFLTDWYDNPATGGAEMLLKGVTGALGAIPAGITYGGAAVGKALGANVDPAGAMHSVQNALTYEPVTSSGQAGQNALKDLAQPFFDPIARGADKAASAVGQVSPTAETFMREAPAAAEAALGVLPVAGAASGAVRGATAAGEEVAANAARPGPGIEGARAAGYKVRPTDVAAANPGATVPGKIREGLQGSHDLQKDLTIQNQAVTNRLAAEDMGLKDGKVTKAAMDAARDPHNAVYEETGQKVGTFATPPELQAALRTATGNMDLPAKLRRDLPGMLENVSGPDALKRVSELRSAARRFLQSKDAKTFDAGHELLDTANAIESTVSSRLEAIGETDQVAKFRAARQSLAKINDYETAFTNNQIDAHVLKRMDKKTPDRMSGNAKVIAEAANAAPNVTALSTKATGTGSVGVPTSKVGVIDKAVSGVAKGAMKLTGTGIDTPKFQGKFGDEMDDVGKSYVPSYGKKPEPFAPPRPGPDPYAADTVPFTPTPGVAPVGTVRGGLGMELMADPVANPVKLPAAPDMLTADSPAPIRGDIDFTASQLPSVDSLAGELGLMPTQTPSGISFQKAPPIVGNDPSGVPHGDMIDFVTDGMSVAPPALSEQLGLPGATLPVPPRSSLVMSKPPGEVGKLPSAKSKGSSPKHDRKKR